MRWLFIVIWKHLQRNTIVEQNQDAEQCVSMLLILHQPDELELEFISVGQSSANYSQKARPNFFLNICILLKYSWLTMFQVHSKVIQLYKYTYIIFEILFHHKLLQDIEYSSVLYSKPLLLVAYLFLIRNLAFYLYCQTNRNKMSYIF